MHGIVLDGHHTCAGTHRGSGCVNELTRCGESAECCIEFCNGYIGIDRTCHDDVTWCGKHTLVSSTQDVRGEGAKGGWVTIARTCIWMSVIGTRSTGACGEPLHIHKVNHHIGNESLTELVQFRVVEPWREQTFCRECNKIVEPLCQARPLNTARIAVGNGPQVASPTLHFLGKSQGIETFRATIEHLRCNRCLAGNSVVTGSCSHCEGDRDKILVRRRDHMDRRSVAKCSVMDGGYNEAQRLG